MSTLIIASLVSVALIAVAFRIQPGIVRVPGPPPGPPQDVAPWRARLEDLQRSGRYSRLDIHLNDSQPGSATFRGEVGAYTVEGGPANGGGRFLVRLLLPQGGLPPGLHISAQQADSRGLGVRAADRAQAEAFLAPLSLQILLQRHLKAIPGLSVQDEQLRLPIAAGQVPPLEGVLDAMQELADALLRPFLAAIAAAGLTASLTGGEPLTATGAQQDHRIRLSLAGGRLEITVLPRLHGRLPTTLHLCARTSDGEQAPGLWLPSPILRGLIVAQGDALTREILIDPEVTGPLLAVLHAFPESRVDRGVVRLCTAAWHPDSLAARVQDAVALAVALEDAAQRALAR